MVKVIGYLKLLLTFFLKVGNLQFIVPSRFSTLKFKIVSYVKTINMNEKSHLKINALVEILFVILRYSINIFHKHKLLESKELVVKDPPKSSQFESVEIAREKFEINCYFK